VGLARASAVRASGNGTWSATIQPDWDILGNANGGYLMAIAARAMIEATGRPDPVTMTGHFLAPAAQGPVTVDVEVVKRGRSFTTASGTLRSPDRPLVAILGTFGDLTAGDGPVRVDAAPPDLPPPDQCIASDPDDRFAPPFNRQVDFRLHPADAGFARNEPSGEPWVRGWFRLPDEPIDAVGLLLAVDAFPPTVFNARLPVAWTPTLELTTHIRARPAAGWLRCAFTSRFVSGGFLEEDGEVWDADDRLVAQSRQLALTPRP
jgi:acyl-CoA thioesterase